MQLITATADSEDLSGGNAAGMRQDLDDGAPRQEPSRCFKFVPSQWDKMPR